MSPRKTEFNQMKVIAKNIQRLLDITNTTQVELSEVLNISESAISKWLSCSNAPSMGNIQKIADHFGVLKSDILEDKPKAKQTKPIKADPLIKHTITNMSKMTEQGKKRVANYSDDILERYKENVPPLTLSDYTELYTIGTAAAGQGFMYGDHIEDYKLVMSTDIPKHDFAITVQGNSMLPTIMDGEVAFVIKDYEKIDRDIYVLDIDGETVIKRVLFGQDEITLLSDNEEFEPRTVAGYDLKQTRIVGRVVGWEMAR